MISFFHIGIKNKNATKIIIRSCLPFNDRIQKIIKGVTNSQNQYLNIRNANIAMYQFAYSIGKEKQQGFIQ